MAMAEMQEPSVDTDKLSYEIFSILESKFLFGYDNQTNSKVSWIPKQISPAEEFSTPPQIPSPSGNNGNESPGVSNIRNQRGKICILSIDGGGMRNIISGKALAYMEHALKVKSGNPDARIADYFDVAAGAGVGGIFTAMLFATKDQSRPLTKADDTWRFLAEQGGKMYRPSGSSGSGGGVLRKLLKKSGVKSSSSATRSNSASLEKLLKEKFTNRNGQPLTLKDTIKPVLIPCYDLSSTAPFLFSRADALENNGYDFRMWEVCRATSADPGVFDPVCMQSVDGLTQCVAVDGGLAMGNPTAAAITHVLHNKGEFPFVRGVEDMMVLSIGTGQVLEGGYEIEEVKGWKSKQWARPMARIAGDGYADLVDHSVAKTFGPWRTSNYLRLQANGSTFGRCGPNVDIDASPSNVKMLVELGDEMLKQKNVESVLFGGKRISEQSNFEKLDWFAEELVQEHQRRSCRIAPTVAFKQANPTPT